MVVVTGQVLESAPGRRPRRRLAVKGSWRGAGEGGCSGGGGWIRVGEVGSFGAVDLATVVLVWLGLVERKARAVFH